MSITDDQTKGKPLTVAIVDDHDVVRFGFESLCAKSNLILLASTSTVAECLTVLEKRKPTVVVLDLSLADGSKVFDNVKTFTQQGIPVLAFSIGDKVNKNRDAIKAGASALVTKSAGLEQLAQAITRVAENKPVYNLQTAAAIDSDLEFKETLDSGKREILSLYSSGYEENQIAFELEIPEHEVSQAIQDMIERYSADESGEVEYRDARLSEREINVLVSYATGSTQKQVSFALGISPATVKEHLDRIRKKYAAVGRKIIDKTDFLRRAIEDGFIDGSD